MDWVNAMIRADSQAVNAMIRADSQAMDARDIARSNAYPLLYGINRDACIQNAKITNNESRNNNGGRDTALTSRRFDKLKKCTNILLPVLRIYEMVAGCLGF